jgi:hypothetical protein
MAHIHDDKRKALQPKSEKCIFVGYSKDVKGYTLLQPHFNEIIIRRDVKFDENILDCEPNSVFVTSLTCEPNSVFVLSSAYEPSSTFVHYSIPTMVSSSSNDDSEDESPLFLAHLPPYESIELEPTPTPPLLRWVHSTREATGDLFTDPSD